MQLSMRSWCALCGEDLEAGRRRCTCELAHPRMSPDPPCAGARIVRLTSALHHVGVGQHAAIRMAVDCVRRPAC